MRQKALMTLIALLLMCGQVSAVSKIASGNVYDDSPPYVCSGDIKFLGSVQFAIDPPVGNAGDQTQWHFIVEPTTQRYYAMYSSAHGGVNGSLQIKSGTYSTSGISQPDRSTSYSYLEFPRGMRTAVSLSGNGRVMQAYNHTIPAASTTARSVSFSQDLSSVSTLNYPAAQNLGRLLGTLVPNPDGTVAYSISTSGTNAPCNSGFNCIVTYDNLQATPPIGGTVGVAVAQMSTMGIDTTLGMLYGSVRNFSLAGDQVNCVVYKSYSNFMTNGGVVNINGRCPHLGIETAPAIGQWYGISSNVFRATSPGLVYQTVSASISAPPLSLNTNDQSRLGYYDSFVNKFYIVGTDNTGAMKVGRMDPLTLAYEASLAAGNVFSVTQQTFAVDRTQRLLLGGGTTGTTRFSASIFSVCG